MIASEKLLQKAIAFQRAGQLAEAEATLRKVLESNPNDVPALGTLGMLLRQQNRVPEAAECFRRICQVQPNNANAFDIFGVCLGMMHRMPEAAAMFREAVRINPSMQSAHANLANALMELGMLEEAEQACRAALALGPTDALALNNLSAILVWRGKHEEAAAVAQSALQLQPDFPEAHYNLGRALRGMKKMSAALDSIWRAVELKPEFPAAQGALAVLLGGFGEGTLAASTIEKALERSPRNADLHNSAGLVYQGQGRLEEAIAHYRRARELSPDMTVAGSNLLFALNDVDQPDPQKVFEEHVAWARQSAEPLTRQSTLILHNHRNEDRPLRVAYISSDFRYHSVAHFLRPIIERHDRSQFEVVCYSGVAAPDGWTQAFKSMDVLWRDTDRMSDEELAQQINADAIDIAVDCSGHTSGHRLLALALRPAPVQVTFLGYPNTTGMSAMDYRITDALADPPGESDRLHVEKLVRLVPTAWCYAAAADAPARAKRREKGPIRFGSFSSLAKITPRWAEVWCRILRAVPDSRMLLKASNSRDPAIGQRVIDMFTSHGIDAGRIEIVPRQPLPADHLATYSRVDIALDTFPYHGTTTTCEAMYMGVPVITLAGRVHASRVGVSLLSAVGLQELIATDEEQFVKLATDVAKDAKRLRKLHTTLRGRMETSPLMDAAGYVAGLERAYREMWRAWVRTSASTVEA